MKKFLVIGVFCCVLSACGVSTGEMRELNAKTYHFSKSANNVKQCLLDKLSDFRPDRMLINDLGEHSEIFIGATQAGKFRSFYLFDVYSDQVKLSHYNGVFPALSETEASNYIKSCQ
ncbi:hypothetical protein ACTUM6_03370 [Basfia succiniciproducens]|uniref:hypothetical protein n=1 Tax=Basfia succiniciproducens TaxID=653940 RepID=UPI003FCEA564